MEHDHFTNQLDAWLDGELDGKSAEELRAHLSVCPECSESVETWKKVRSAFASLPAEKPSPALAVRVMEAIRNENPFSFRLLLKWLFPTFSFTAVTVGLILFWPIDPPYAMEGLYIKGSTPVTVEALSGFDESWEGLGEL